MYIERERDYPYYITLILGLGEAGRDRVRPGSHLVTARARECSQLRDAIVYYAIV